MEVKSQGLRLCRFLPLLLMEVKSQGVVNKHTQSVMCRFSPLLSLLGGLEAGAMVTCMCG
jgi:hypothetical protein